jgi:hypothetical protein
VLGWDARRLRADLCHSVGGLALVSCSRTTCTPASARSAHALEVCIQVSYEQVEQSDTQRAALAHTTAHSERCAQADE